MNQNYSLKAHFIIVVFWSSLLIRENFSLYLKRMGQIPLNWLLVYLYPIAKFRYENRSKS